MNFLKRHPANGHRGKTILLTTFSSCVNCANIIIDSGIIDVVAFEILAQHWSTIPNDAKTMLDNSLPHWTKDQIEKDTNNDLIRKWLSNS